MTDENNIQFMARQQIKNNKNANSTEFYTLQIVPAMLLMDCQ